MVCGEGKATAGDVVRARGEERAVAGGKGFRPGDLGGEAKEIAAAIAHCEEACPTMAATFVGDLWAAASAAARGERRILRGDREVRDAREGAVGCRGCGALHARPRAERSRRRGDEREHERAAARAV